MKYQKILLIDDDLDDQEIFLTALERVSKTLTLVAMADAGAALKKLESEELAPDLIFLDLNMPVMTGEQFLEKIKGREKLKSIPIIIFSTTSHPSIIQNTLALGAQDFITKPDKFNDLVNILQSKL